MRLNLEQLKAMSDEELLNCWCHSEFPFDMASCGACLTMHLRGLYCRTPHAHAAVATALSAMHLTSGRFFPGEARLCLEELYALRLFYDHLYPQPDGQESQLPSGFAAQPDSSVGNVGATDEQLEQMVRSDRDWSANTR